MKDLFEGLISVIENAKGVQATIEKELKAYYDINKSAIEDAQKKMTAQMEDMMKSISNPADIGGMMKQMFSLMTEIMGEENFKKFTEMQSKYPFLKDIFQKIIPTA
jgi:DNA-binding transcriptional regulator GbsR (MarR family)